MKNSSTAAAFIVLTIITAACSLDYKRGNGNIVTEVTELNDFDKIYVGGNYEVTLIEDNENKVIIRTDENLIQYINVELKDGALNINNVHRLKGSEGISVEVYCRNINKIYSTGASEIVSDGLLKTTSLDISLSGAGAITLEVESAETNVNLSGAGVVELLGETEQLEGHISGAGGLLASEYISKECNITLSGLGGAEVYVTEILTATITGVGGIEYGGNPKVIEKQITGFGKIKRAKEYIEDEND
jgi:hypothetical protein